MYEPAGEGWPNEVVVGQPVVEHWNERLPLSIPLVHRNRHLAGGARLLHFSLLRSHSHRTLQFCSPQHSQGFMLLQSPNTFHVSSVVMWLAHVAKMVTCHVWWCGLMHVVNMMALLNKRIQTPFAVRDRCLLFIQPLSNIIFHYFNNIKVF